MKTRKLFNLVFMLAAGLFIGIAVRSLDIYFQNLGEVFSQVSVCILMGTLIAIYSPTKKVAMQNIFSFYMGMLLTYYATAMLTRGAYGWTVFTFLSPIMAHFLRMYDKVAWCVFENHRCGNRTCLDSIQYFAL